MKCRPPKTHQNGFNFPNYYKPNHIKRVPGDPKVNPLIPLRWPAKI